MTARGRVVRRLAAPATMFLAICASCGSGGSHPATTTTTAPATVRPVRVFPGPAGLTAGGQPLPNGFMWLLARVDSATTLQELNLTTGHIALIIPAPSSSIALAQSPSGLVGIGTATNSTGALEFANGASGAIVATVAIGDPVKAVAAGTDGTTFYVLNGSTSSASVSLVNDQSDKVADTVPVPLDTVSIAVDPKGQNLFALRKSGHVDEITLGTGAVTASFPVGSTPLRLTPSNDGDTLYVLKSADNGAEANVSVLDLATESQTKALTAPAHSVDLQLSPDGQSLYTVVGTPSLGNVQQFALHP